MSKITLAAAIIAASFYGAINWKPVNTLDEANVIRVAAKSIAVGVRDHASGGQSRCNYWVLDQAKRFVMANGHCIDDPDGTQLLRIKFNDSNNWINCPRVVAYSPWELLDYVVVKCNADLPEALPIERRPVEQFEKLTHISHNCNYYPVGGDSQCRVQAMYDASEDCQVLDYRTRGGIEYKSGCDALGGSSGSPYLTRFPNKDGKLAVVGLYHAAHFFPDSRGDLEGKGAGNFAMRIDVVMAEIDRKGIFDDPVAQPEPPEDEPVDEPVVVDEKDPVSIILDAIWVIIKNIILLFKA